jgi:predicted transcriptional regulator
MARGNPDRREQIMAFICEYAGDRSGPTPSIKEISDNLGWTYSVVYHHVQRLITEGRLAQRNSKLCVIGSEWYPPKTY